MQEKKLFVLDGYGLIYRSYFAFINRPMTDTEGRNISAVFGFFRMFFSILKKEGPDYLAVCMDSIGPTFRHQMYDQYKATREKTPEDLHAQIPQIESILSAAGIPVLRQVGMEADDLIATLVKSAASNGYESVIVSSDKDLLQLVDDSVHALRPKKGEMAYMDRQAVLDEFGIRADQIVDYLALIGDSSDNVPGVKGIGPKGAVKLLEQFDTLEGIYENLKELSPSVRKKLEENRESAFLSQRLVRLEEQADICCDVASFSVDSFDLKKMVPFFQQIGSKGLIEEAGGTASVIRQEVDPEDELLSSLTGKGAYTVVTTEKELSELAMSIRAANVVALDTETDDLDANKASLVGISVCFKERKACYIPLVAGSKPVVELELVRRILLPVLSDPEVRIVGQNIKYDHTVLSRHGLELGNLYFDTMIAAWLIDAGATSYGLDKLAELYLGYRMIKFNEVVPKGSLFPEIDIESASEYAAEDADITYRLYRLFKRKLERLSLFELFEQIEMPMVRILSRMEQAGIGLDTHLLSSYAEELTARMEELQQRIFAEAQMSFNLNSPKQLQEVLFEKRGLPTGKKTKTGFSTDTNVLEELSHYDVIPAWILEYRALAKLLGTYVTALPLLVDPATGRIHTSFVQTGTATGRLSSRNPNLQNIPIRSEDGRRIRSAFVPQEGCVFLSADYSQIELVILAHVSEDPGLRDAFLKQVDIHRYTASLIFEIPIEEVSDAQRRIAKTINFGVMYGMSPFRLSRELNIPRSQASEFIDAYFTRYQGVRSYMDRTIAEAQKEGYVTTMYGHRRTIAGITSRNRTEAAGAERIAVNTPIQGSAADIMKLAMIATDRELKKRNLKTRLLLQVHDELIFEVPQGEVEEVRTLVRETMESVVELKVPLKVSIETGNSWGEMH